MQPGNGIKNLSLPPQLSNVLGLSQCIIFTFQILQSNLLQSKFVLDLTGSQQELPRFSLEFHKKAYPTANI